VPRSLPVSVGLGERCCEKQDEEATNINYIMLGGLVEQDKQMKIKIQRHN